MAEPTLLSANQTPIFSEKSGLRLAVFDCDGTLVDSQSSIVSSMAATSLAHGLAAPDPESVRRIVGLPLEIGIARLFPDLQATAIASIREGYRQAFMEMRQSGDILEPLYPGVLEALDLLDQAGWLLGVATGKSHKGLLGTLAAHDLEGRFITLQTADRAAGKPHPEMIHNAVSETGADATQTVMIGDTTFDMEMARNANVWAIGVAWGYHEVDELTAAGAHTVVHDWADMPAAINELMTGEKWQN